MTIVESLKQIVGSESIKIKKDNKMLFEGLWDPSVGTIFINEEHIKQNSKEQEIDSVTYALIIYFHEFGHAIDEELKEIDNYIIEFKTLIREVGYKDKWFNKYSHYSYKAEENAWRIARDFVQEDFLDDFMKMRDTSLELHREILGMERKLFKKDNKKCI